MALDQATMLRYINRGKAGVWVSWMHWAFMKQASNGLYTILDCNNSWVWWEVPAEWASRILTGIFRMTPSRQATYYQAFWGQARPDARQWCQQVLQSACDIDAWINNACPGETSTNGNQVQSGGQTGYTAPCDCRTASDNRVPVGPPPILPPAGGGSPSGGPNRRI